MDQQKGRGKNIKVFDKIKIQHLASGYRLHPTDYDCRHGNGSYNQGVACHKIRDQTDWFVILRLDQKQQSLNYHFQYGDSILLSNCKAKKYLHASDQYESQITKNFEVSVCDNGEGSPHCPQDQWVVEQSIDAKGQYWTVGSVIKLKGANCGGYLASHRRKLKDSGENQVFALKIQEKEEKEQNLQQNPRQELIQWVVSEIDPFIYSANIKSEKKQKVTEEESELHKLRQIKKTLPKPQKPLNNPTVDLLILGNERIRQIEEEEKKIHASEEKEKSCWRKYFCCCCPSGQNDGYSKF